MKVSFCRKRQSDIAKYFSMEADLLYWKKVWVMEELQLQHASEQWRLFIDSFKVSLKAVLLFDGNKHLTIPLAHAAHMKENCANIQDKLKKICCECHQWNLCADVKVVAMQTGL